MPTIFTVGYPSLVLLDDGTIGTAYYSVDNRPIPVEMDCWGIHGALVRYRQEDTS